MSSIFSKTTFAEYAEDYDLLYANKNYAEETQFVHDFLGEFGARRESLLELGCGTGRHASEFARQGWSVKGVDISEQMVTHAKRRARKAPAAEKGRLSFSVGDIKSVRTGKQYDATVSLFHVMGYQTSNGELRNAFQTAALHLKKGGLFFFDFWFGPAVLTDAPCTRVKRFSNSKLSVTRISESALDPIKNVVTVTFEILIESKKTGIVHRIQEQHRVRYFFLPELMQLLEDCGFSVLGHGKWLSRERLDLTSWYGWVAGRKVD